MIARLEATQTQRTRCHGWKSFGHPLHESLNCVNLLGYVLGEYKTFIFDIYGSQFK